MASVSILPLAPSRTTTVCPLEALDAVSRARNLAHGAHLAVSALAADWGSSSHAVAALLDAVLAELANAEDCLTAAP